MKDLKRTLLEVSKCKGRSGGDSDQVLKSTPRDQFPADFDDSKHSPSWNNDSHWIFAENSDDRMNNHEDILSEVAKNRENFKIFSNQYHENGLSESGIS